MAPKPTQIGVEVDDSDYLTIGQAAHAAKVSVDTIRRWEREGRIPPAQRTRGGHRRYRRSDIEPRSAS